MKDLLRTLATGGTVVGLTGLLGPVVSVMALRDEESPDPVLRFWARSILSAAGVAHEAHGVEHVPTHERFVLVLNHQSHFDTLLLLAHLPHHLRFVGKTELFKIPVFGHAMRALGNIEVTRDRGGGDQARLQAAISRVQQKVSVVFFAEGTRSADGQLQPFKKGAAMLALEAQVPIVPAAIAGTRDILPKGSRWIRGHQRAALVVGEPISTRGLGVGARDELTRQAHQAVAGLLEQANRSVSG